MFSSKFIYLISGKEKDNKQFPPAGKKDLSKQEEFKKEDGIINNSFIPIWIKYVKFSKINSS